MGAAIPDSTDSDRNTVGAVDFFVSYTATDQAWATWIAAELEAAGCAVLLQAWDCPPGENFVAWISRQMEAARRTVAVCSPAYFTSHWCTQEWTGALAGQKLIPLRVADCTLPPVLATVGWRDLYDLEGPSARARLLEAVGVLGVPRVASAGFPGAEVVGPGARPSGVPKVWNAPPRLASFTGRAELLRQIHDRLHRLDCGGRVAVVQAAALHGMGGVGKTQLSIEYAHQHRADYQLVWWIDAEQSTLIGEKIAALSGHIGLTTSGVIADDAAAVQAALRGRDDWLLIFDNAPEPAVLRPWLPSGSGHLLITSRNPSWGQLANRVSVAVLDRPEAVALLRHRLPDLDDDTAEALAFELGDLPLALEQAAAYMEQTALPPATYLQRFRDRRQEMLARGTDLAYNGTVDTVWNIALKQLEHTAPAAAVLLQICAHLAPEPIPLSWFTEHASILPSPLSEEFAGFNANLVVDDVTASILAYALARRVGGFLVIHRLVALVIRARQSVEHSIAYGNAALALLAAVDPGQPRDPASWPGWTALGPHLLHAMSDLDAADPHRLRFHLNAFCWSQFARGDYPAAYQLAVTLYRDAGSVLGADHLDTLSAAHNLAVMLRTTGELQQARRLAEDTLARRRRLLGADHTDTLTTASNLIAWLSALNDLQAARQLAEDTLGRQRRILGDDGPSTLGTAHNLAVTLSKMGEHRAARDLNDDTLVRRQRVLGRDHPDTLRSAASLAFDLANLGEHRAAREIYEDTLTRRRQVLGPHHPDTSRSEAFLRWLDRHQSDIRSPKAVEIDTWDT